MKVILFDGVCNLCNSSIDFVIKRDKKRLFKFGSLQSDIAKKILATYKFNTNYLNTIVYIENQKIYTESDAALKILKNLNFPWNLSFIFILIPKILRNFIYKTIANNRYRWFGKRELCRLPTPEEKSQFI